MEGSAWPPVAGPARPSEPNVARSPTARLQGVPPGDRRMPAVVHRFVERYLASAAELEVLLLVHRLPDERWHASAVARALRIDINQAGAMLSRLARHRLLRRVGDGFCYEPKTPALASAVQELADAYPTFRVAIVSLIFSRPTGPIRDFSDAFRFRPERD